MSKILKKSLRVFELKYYALNKTGKKNPMVTVNYFYIITDWLEFQMLQSFCGTILITVISVGQLNRIAGNPL